MGKKIFGQIGDIDPAEHGGGMVFSDEENIWIEYCCVSNSVEPLLLHIVHVPTNCLEEYNWIDLSDMSECVDQSIEHLCSIATSHDVMQRVDFIDIVGSYYGWNELDYMPVKIDHDQLIERWNVEKGEENE
jgi:hypothetical protein